MQEKETNVNVNAMKNNPRIPPLSEAESTLFTHEDGSVISNAPRNEAAKMKNKRKRNKLRNTLLAIMFGASGPKKLQRLLIRKHQKLK